MPIALRHLVKRGASIAKEIGKQKVRVAKLEF